jgi:hypothetical protein
LAPCSYLLIADPKGCRNAHLCIDHNFFEQGKLFR